VRWLSNPLLLSNPLDKRIEGVDNWLIHHDGFPSCSNYGIMPFSSIRMMESVTSCRKSRRLLSTKAWARWLLTYASQPDPRIRLGILFGPAIVVTGCVATMGIFAATNLRRTKELSQNMEDLPGSAHWATPDDVRETGLLAARQGIYIGGWYNEAEGHLHCLRDDGPAHVLAFATRAPVRASAWLSPGCSSGWKAALSTTSRERTGSRQPDSARRRAKSALGFLRRGSEWIAAQSVGRNLDLH
jgi:hypothetical protein